MPTIAVYHIANMRDFPSWEDSRAKIERAVAVADYDHVFTYEARDTPLFEGDPLVPYNVLEHAFREFNIGNWNEVGSLAHAYRRAGRQPDELGNRSLSVGDVVTVEVDGDTRAYVCASLGWVDVTVAWVSLVAEFDSTATSSERKASCAPTPNAPPNWRTSPRTSSPPR